MILSAWNYLLRLLEGAEAGEGAGDGEVVLEKNAVICHCGSSSGDLPLLGLCASAFFFLCERERRRDGREEGMSWLTLLSRKGGSHMPHITT